MLPQSCDLLYPQKLMPTKQQYCDRKKKKLGGMVPILGA